MAPGQARICVGDRPSWLDGARPLDRGQRLLTRFRLPATLVFATILYGTFGYILLEGWSLTDALYMTVTTLATVGFGEVRPLDPSGKLFTISLILLGVAAMAATIDAAAGALVSGELQAAFRRRRMRRRLNDLHDHYIVCAYGRVGRAAVAELRADGVDVLVVEPKPELAGLLEDHAVPYLIADPTNEAVLRQSGIERARGLLCAADSDAANVFITLTARALHPTMTIVARASDPASVETLLRAGADHVVSPYAVSGRHMGVLATHPAIVDYLDLARLAPGMRLEQIEVRPASPLADKAIGETRARYPDAHVLALKRVGVTELIVPEHETTLLAGDLVLVLGPEQTLKTMAG